MNTIHHNGRTTAFRVSSPGAERTTGDRSPVLCVHGSGGTHAIWKSQLARLSSNRPIVALDLSGHGESTDFDAPDGSTSLDAYARDVRAVMDETNARVLVGNSLGGAVVLHAILEHGLSPDAVVLAGSGAKLAVSGDLLDWLAGEDGGFEQATTFLHGDDLLFHDASEDVLKFSSQAMHEVGRAVVERDFRTCHTFDVRDQLAEIACPVLALTGEYDRLTPPAYHEYIADNVTEGEWATLQNAAHLSMLESPDAFNNTLSDFLDEQGL